MQIKKIFSSESGGDPIGGERNHFGKCMVNQPLPGLALYAEREKR